MKIIKSCIGTKIISKWSDMACNIALDAVSTVAMEEHGRREIDIKRYAKVEKVIRLDARPIIGFRLEASNYWSCWM